MRWSGVLRYLFCSLVLTTLAHAHKPSDSYVQLEKTSRGLHGRWDVAIRDLEPAVGLDTNHDGQVTWGELRGRSREVQGYLQRHIQARATTGGCEVALKPAGVIAHSDGGYAAFDLAIECPGDAPAITLRYDLLFDIDAQHRGVLHLTDGAAPLVFSKARRELTISRSRPGFSAIIRLGIEHIWSGYDHLLFLLALLLPAVLERRDGRWTPVDNFRRVLLDVLRTVTAFTLAHSLTLALAATHWVVLPSRFVESAIAASIVLAALNNLFPVIDAERSLAFGLGLLHGFGFAAVLSDVGVSGRSFVSTLFGFNLGVEIGQLAVVAALLPLLHWLRRSRHYPKWGLPIASGAVIVVASVWLLERALDLKLIS